MLRYDNRLKSRRGQITVASFAFLLVALAVLALVDFNLASRFLLMLIGGLIGGAVAYLVTYPYRRRISDRSRALDPFTAHFLGLASGLVIVLGAGFVLPMSLSDKDGTIGFALGFAINLQQRLSPPTSSVTQEEMRRNRRWALRGLLAVVGAILLLFALYVLTEYVVGPITGYFAQ